MLRRPPEARLRTSLYLFFGALVVYASLAGPRLLGPSTDPHFTYLARAYLAGSLELVDPPPHRNDWATVLEVELKDGRSFRGTYRSAKRGDAARQLQTLGGPIVLIESGTVQRTRRHHYVSFPPFPALLLLPFVALFGLATWDVLFTVIVAAFNVVLLYRFLDDLSVRGSSSRSDRDNLLLALFFGFGTGHAWCAVLGQVWFTALICGVGLSITFLWCVEAGRPWLAGLALACALATRTPLAFLAIYYPLRLWWDGERWSLEDLRGSLGVLGRAALPPALMLGLLGLHNWLRFGSVGEFGHTFLAAGTIQRIAWHGLFDLRFLPKNLVAALLLLPRLHGAPPFLALSKHGMSIFFSSPALVWLARPRHKPALHRALWVTVVCTALPALLYQNTGYEQFGYRFVLDYLPLLVTLLAIGDRRFGRAFVAAVLFGVVVNLFGAVVFKRYELFFDAYFPLDNAL